MVSRHDADGEQEAKLKIVSDSHVKKTLNALREKDHPDFVFEVDLEAEVSDLLKQVAQGELMFTVADSVELSLSQRVYPEIAVAFELTEDQPFHGLCAARKTKAFTLC